MGAAVAKSGLHSCFCGSNAENTVNSRPLPTPLPRKVEGCCANTATWGRGAGGLWGWAAGCPCESQVCPPPRGRDSAGDGR